MALYPGCLHLVIVGIGRDPREPGVGLTLGEDSRDETPDDPLRGVPLPPREALDKLLSDRLGVHKSLIDCAVDPRMQARRSARQCAADADTVS